MAHLQHPIFLGSESRWHGASQWDERLCLPPNERVSAGFGASRGYLADDPRVDAILWNILLFGPAAALLISAPFRIYTLYRAKLVTAPNYRGIVKAFATFTLFALQLTHVVLGFLETSNFDIALAASLLALIASTALCVVSFLEHGRTVAPSTLLTSYLLFSIFAHLIQVGLYWVAKNLCYYSPLAIAIFVTKLIVAGLELQNKTPILREQYRSLSPEERGGFYSNAIFWWVNKYIALGNAKILSGDDMPPLASYMDTMKMREAMQQQWDKRKKPEGRWSLMIAQFTCMWRANVDVIPPRLLYAVFRYCQPFLISRAITYVSSNLPPMEDRNEAFRLILLTFTIYFGMAIFNGLYDARSNRLTVMSGMGIIGLIHNRCLTIKDGIFDESAAVTLMSNDADAIQYTAQLVHELWAQSLELGIGLYLLATELGWVCLMPLLLVAATSQGGRYITVNIAGRQKALTMTTQSRVSMTKAILDSMKNIKMMGLVDKMEAKIQKARDSEIKAYISFNWLIVGFNIAATVVTLFSPAVTLILYALQAQLRGGKAIDVNTAFTSLAVIGMVTGPANYIIVLMPNFAMFFAAYDRIQKYLLSPDREDKREYLDKRYSNASNGDTTSSHASEPSSDSDSTMATLIGDGQGEESVAVAIENATIRPALTADPALKDISATFKKGSLIVCAGAVGTGKTTLAKALLGDLPPDSGVIKTAFGSISYCSQTAWLINGTIKDIIRGPPGDTTELDEAWYGKVLHACDLEEDLQQLPDGDQTVVGSRGITLSGGQKQRVALARAVYSRRKLIILDDVLSALDATTERHIVDNLIGPNGLFKELGTTVLLITHATQHLPLADYIVVIGEDGKIAEQGTWADLRSSAGYISQVVVKDAKHSPNDNRDNHGREGFQGSSPKAPKAELEDLSRKTGDITLYGYYFGAIGASKLLVLVCSMSVYAVFLGLTPYWLRWWAESGGEDMWYYSGVFFLISLGAFCSLMTTIGNLFLVIAPRSGNTLHARLLRTVMHAPQSYFGTTDTGTTLNRFSADTSMIDRRLPRALLLVGQSVFRLLSQWILLGVVQPFMIVTLPVTFVVVFLVQKFYLATSRQLRFLDLETRAAVNASFLETLEGVATIRAFGWQRPFVNDNVKKVEQQLRPAYMLMAIQRWLNTVLDLIVMGLAMLVISLAVWLKGTTTGGQIGIALNVVLQANSFLLRLVEAWTSMETSLGAISRLRSFETDLQPEDKPGEVLEPPSTWPARGEIDFDHMSAGYNTSTLAVKDMTVAIKPGQKVGVCGRTGAGKSSLLLSLLRLIEIESGTIRIDDLDIQTMPRNAIRSRIITVPQEPMLVMTDTVRQNLDITESAASDDEIIQALEKVKLWSVLQARTSNTAEAGRQDRELEASMGGAPVPANGSSSSATRAPTAIDAATLDPDAKPLLVPDPEESGDSATENLNATMKSLPLSQGQQQLFSLARAMLMRSTRGKVVLLDEATSNVDVETNNLMQRIIRDEFREHTIITVAHRLDTIMDSDVVLVLDGGKLVEVGPPGDLVQKEGGVFKTLYGGH
ncbi:hypothetical protein V8F06_006919 [Rhypophila decipiens]